MYEISLIVRNTHTDKKFGGMVPVERREDIMPVLVEIAATMGSVLETRGDL